MTGARSNCTIRFSVRVAKYKKTKNTKTIKATKLIEQETDANRNDNKYMTSLTGSTLTASNNINSKILIGSE